MGLLNLRNGLNGLGAAATTIGSAYLQEDMARKRDERLAAYRKQETDAAHQRGQADALAKRVHETEMNDARIANDTKLAEQKRADDLAAEERGNAQKMKELQFKADNKVGGINVTTNMGAGESAYAKTLGTEQAKADVKRETEAETAVLAANEMEADLSIMEDIMSNRDTGMTEEMLAQAGRLFGTDASAAMQAFDATSSTLVLELAGKLSGVISDRDMKVIENAAPTFGKDPRANKIIIGKLRGAINRSRENYSSMMEHKDSNNGHLKGWRPPNVVNSSARAQETVDAANNPSEAISGSYSRFQQFKAGKQ